MVEMLQNVDYGKSDIANNIEDNSKSTIVDIFISFSTKDYEKVRTICDRLKKRYSCWISCFGKEKNEEAIKSCKYFFPFFSHEYFKDCKEELLCVIARNKENSNNPERSCDILPIFVDNITMNEIPGEIQSSLIIDDLPSYRTTLPFYGKGISENSESEIFQLIDNFYKEKSTCSIEVNDKEQKFDTLKDVFISYAHADSKSVNTIYEKLKEKAPDCWWCDNEQLDVYRGFDAVIYRAIKNCKCFVAFFSENYFNSDYCRNTELSQALRLNKNIIPVFLDGFVDFPDAFRSYVDKLIEIEPIGYQQDLKSKPAEEICESIIGTSAFKLLNFWEKGLPGVIPKIDTVPCILNKLVTHLKTQQKQYGNYLSPQDVSQNLFPLLKKLVKHDESLTDDDADEEWEEDAESGESNKSSETVITVKDDNEYRYLLPENWKIIETPLIDRLMASKHEFLIGEGGLGKTTTLIESCRWLLSMGEYAVYVPLKSINSHNSLHDYLTNKVFGGNKQMYNIAENIMNGDRPFYVFLDGFNEMAADYVGNFIDYLKTNLLPGHKAVKLIITSRYSLLDKFGEVKKDFSLFQLQPLDKSCVDNYINSCELTVGDKDKDKILNLLRTPLMLTLYCNSENAKKKYESGPIAKQRIELRDPPDTAAKILHNYFQTQLYRAIAENTFNESVILTLLEYILPYIGMEMLRKNTLSLSEDELYNCVFGPAEPLGKAKYFSRYIKKYIRKYEKIKYDRNDATNAYKTIEHDCAFIVQNEEGCSFSHQFFRDFFAAKFLCLEMEDCQDPILASRENTLDLSAMKYSDDVLSLVADLKKEYEYAPKRSKETRVWEFSSETSPTEQFLYKLKNKKDDSAQTDVYNIAENKKDDPVQTAVYNLFNVLRLGRDSNLFSCDFSYLDLRACNLNGIKFSEFDKKRTHSASFEGAYIDNKCFMQSGHSDPVTAMCITKGDDILYTADSSGKAFAWNLKELKDNKQLDPNAEYSIADDRIIRIKLSKDESKLLVLTDHSATAIDLKNKTVGESQFVPPHKYLRDVRDNDGVIEVTYDTSPLTWHTLSDGDRDSSSKDKCLISGCVRQNPCFDAYVYSNIGGKIITDDGRSYWLYQHLYNEIAQSKAEGVALSCYYEIKNNPRVNDICWHSSGNKLLVAYSNTLFEFAYSTGNGLRYLTHIAFNGAVTAVSYMNDGRIIACTGVYINILKTDENQTISDIGYKFSSCYTPGVIKLLQKDSSTYLLSKNKELKKLDEHLIVQRIRQLKRSVQDICFAKSLDDGKPFICLLVKNGFETHCEKYDMDSDEYTILNTDFEFINDREDHSDKQYTHYIDKKQKRIVSINREDSNRKIYENRFGLFIQGCSFKDTKIENIEMIKQNGGINANEEQY